jgi:hypothetical protein
VKTWSVKAKNNLYETVACRFNKITRMSQCVHCLHMFVLLSLVVIPTPQGMSTNRITERLDSPKASVRRTEGESVMFKCNIIPNNTSTRPIQWRFSSEDDNKTTSELPVGVERVNDEIRIGKVKKFHRGYYRCRLNGVFFQVQLRVKG